TPSALAEGRSPSPGTKLSQIAASARARSAMRPAYRSHFQTALQIEATSAPGVHRRGHEHPHEARDRHGEERADDPPDLEAQHEGEDRADRMDADRVRRESREQHVRFD